MLDNAFWIGTLCGALGGIPIGLFCGLLLFLIVFSSVNRWTVKFFGQAVASCARCQSPPTQGASGLGPVAKSVRPVKFGPVAPGPGGDPAREWREAQHMAEIATDPRHQTATRRL